MFRIFLRRNHRWFSRFPLFFGDHPSFSRKSPTFFGKSPTFLSKLPTFFQKTPFFFSKSSSYTSTKKSKFGEKYSQDRRTPFLLPLYFLVSLCFARQSVKVVKAKSAKLLYVRARERVRDSIRMPSLPTLFGCAFRETERGITISVL